MNHAGIVVAMLFVPLGETQFGWLTLNLVIAAFVALSVLLVYRSLAPLAVAALPSRISWRAVLVDGRAWWFCLAHAISFGLYLSLVAWLVKYLVGEFAAGSTAVVAISTAITVWAFLSRSTGGLVSRHMGEFRFILVSSGGIVLTFGLMALWPSLPLAVFGLALATLTANLPFGAIFALAGRSFPGGLTGRRLSFILTPASIIAFILPVVFGYTLEQSGAYSTGFLIWTVVAAAIFVAMLATQSSLRKNPTIQTIEVLSNEH
jgi:nitrate/nitrite transporter NarK